MVPKLSFIATRSGKDRSRANRLARWSIVAIAGTISGVILGDIVAEPLAEKRAAATVSFSGLSANPDSQNAADGGAPPCLDCPDSYGVSAKLRADREQRMSNEFRDLGAVDIIPPRTADPIDDYKYGGRFPDPEPPTPIAAPPVDAIAAGPLTADEAPADTMRPPPSA